MGMAMAILCNISIWKKIGRKKAGNFLQYICLFCLAGQIIYERYVRIYVYKCLVVAKKIYGHVLKYIILFCGFG